MRRKGGFLEKNTSSNSPIKVRYPVVILYTEHVFSDDSTYALNFSPFLNQLRPGSANKSEKIARLFK